MYCVIYTMIIVLMDGYMIKAYLVLQCYIVLCSLPCNYHSNPLHRVGVNHGIRYFTIYRIY